MNICQFTVKKEFNEQYEFILLHSNEVNLKKEAEKTKYEIQLSNEADAGGISEFVPGYAPFDSTYQADNANIFRTYRNGSNFREIDRTRLAYSAI